jgi:O-glycosyl hydrolase
MSDLGVNMKKRYLIGLLCSFVLLFSTVFAGGYFLGSNSNITINLSREFQTIDGFGASGAWLMQYVGGRDDYEEMVQHLWGTGENDLNLNFYRYKVGAGSDGDERIGDRFRRAISFYVGDGTGFDNIANYDFSRDENSVRVMKHAASINPDLKIILFAKSPHQSMTISGSAMGNFDGGTNLCESRYRDFALYMWTIAKHLRDEWNLPIYAVCPINEPQWQWGHSTGTPQEGCFYTPQQAAKLLRVFADVRREMGLCDIKLDGPESAELRLTSAYFRAMFRRENLRGEIDTVSVHSYWNDNSNAYKRFFGAYMRIFYPNIRLAQTEWCHMEGGRDETMNSALLLANVMNSDFIYLNAVSWSHWLSVSSYWYNDGLIYVRNGRVDREVDYEIAKRFHTMAHFSRYIEAGATRVKATIPFNQNNKNIALSAFRNPNGEIVLVVINNANTSKKININGNFTIKNQFTTTLEQNHQSGIGLNLPPESISTFILTN